MFLLIDSTNFNFVRFAILKPSGQLQKQSYAISLKTEKVLGLLEMFLKKNKIKSQQLQKICLVSGAGSFTGIRVGFAIALAFSSVYPIKIFTIEKKDLPLDLKALTHMKLLQVGKDFSPNYGAKPKITKEKKKILKNTGPLSAKI